MPVPAFLQSIVSYLRAGYPDGVPERDYFPIFALLRRRLSTDELAEVAEELSQSWPAAEPAIRTAIQGQTHEPASDADVERVRSHLASAGLHID